MPTAVRYVLYVAIVAFFVCCGWNGRGGAALRVDDVVGGIYPTALSRTSTNTSAIVPPAIVPPATHSFCFFLNKLRKFTSQLRSHAMTRDSSTSLFRDNSR